MDHFIIKALLSPVKNIQHSTYTAQIVHYLGGDSSINSTQAKAGPFHYQYARQNEAACLLIDNDKEYLPLDNGQILTLMQLI